MTQKQYLDYDGLALYDEKIKQTVEAGDTIRSISVNNTPLTPSNKSVNINVPTSSADLSDGSTLASKNYVDTAIGQIAGITFQIVQTYEQLPSTGTTGTIYLIPNSGSNPNIYDEYVWIATSSTYERIGSTDVDLSDYVQTSDLVAITNAQINALFA